MSIIEQLNNQHALINAVFKFLKSENKKRYDHQLLIDKCAHFNWLIYREDNFTLAQVTEITTAVLELIENDDFNWFIDTNQTTGDSVTICHSQKPNTIALNKTCLLLPLMLEHALHG